MEFLIAFIILLIIIIVPILILRRLDIDPYEFSNTSTIITFTLLTTIVVSLIISENIKYPDYFPVNSYFSISSVMLVLFLIIALLSGNGTSKRKFFFFWAIYGFALLFLANLVIKLISGMYAH